MTQFFALSKNTAGKHRLDLLFYNDHATDKIDENTCRQKKQKPGQREGKHIIINNSCIRIPVHTDYRKICVIAPENQTRYRLWEKQRKKPQEAAANSNPQRKKLTVGHQ